MKFTVIINGEAKPDIQAGSLREAARLAGKSVLRDLPREGCVCRFVVTGEDGIASEFTHTHHPHPDLRAKGHAPR